MAGFLFAAVGSVAAQSFQDSNPRSLQDRPTHRQDDFPSASPSNLPDWAEPSQTQPQSSGSSVGSGDAQAKAMQPPDPPGDPQQIPVDGGLALLAAAGAGYAVRKLNEDEEEEPV